ETVWVPMLVTVAWNNAWPPAGTSSGTVDESGQGMFAFSVRVRLLPDSSGRFGRAATAPSCWPTTSDPMRPARIKYRPIHPNLSSIAPPRPSQHPFLVCSTFRLSTPLRAARRGTILPFDRVRQRNSLSQGGARPEVQSEQAEALRLCL